LVEVTSFGLEITGKPADIVTTTPSIAAESDVLVVILIRVLSINVVVMPLIQVYEAIIIVRDVLGADVLAEGAVPAVHQVVVSVVVPPGAQGVGGREVGHAGHAGSVQTSQAQAPGLLGEGLLTLHHLPIDLVEVDLTDLVNNILIVKSYEAEASVSVSDLVISPQT